MHLIIRDLQFSIVVLRDKFMFLLISRSILTLVQVLKHWANFNPSI